MQAEMHCMFEVVQSVLALHARSYDAPNTDVNDNQSTVGACLSHFPVLAFLLLPIATTPICDSNVSIAPAVHGLTPSLVLCCPCGCFGVTQVQIGIRSNYERTFRDYNTIVC